MSAAHRKLVVEQALVLVEQNYVHLPHKAAMHAVNPVQRLRLLRARLDNTSREALPPAEDFHAEMSEIFHSMRDLHTNYLLPEPYASRVAFLPFLVEEYFTDTVAQYMVTKVARGADLAGLEPGVLVTHWNGMPIDRAVEVNAARYAGSNAAARHTRGVESLTVRPLRVHRFPDEDWVVVRYLKDGEARELQVPWLVAPNLPSMVSAAAERGRRRDRPGAGPGHGRRATSAQAAVRPGGGVCRAAGPVDRGGRADRGRVDDAGCVPSLPASRQRRRVRAPAHLHLQRRRPRWVRRGVREALRGAARGQGWSSMCAATEAGTSTRRR